MCGIVGFLDKHAVDAQQRLVDMTSPLYHRGPDDGGTFVESLTIGQIGLGHRRLSILDLTTHGHQPFIFENLTMVYNGEIYNFKEIRTLLETKGYSFDSHSDTEVVLKAYHCWGVDCVQQFNGMFAIAIFDKIANKLILIRDRAGVKPLFWYYHDGLFMFSSELKSFHQHPKFEKKLSLQGVGLFLQYGYIPQPYSIFEHTHKLQAGHILEVNLTTFDIAIKKYWDVIDCYNKPKLDLDEREALTLTEALLKSACEYRMVADVPVGVFLSGGYDSSAVTALLQSDRTEKLKTYSIGFHESGYNEAHYAKAVAEHLGTDHTEYYCTYRDALDIFPKLPEIWDEPFGDPSAIPTTLVSQLARKDVTVSLSADGGDEVFGGYNKYTVAHNHYNHLISEQAKQYLNNYLATLAPELRNNQAVINNYLQQFYQATAQNSADSQVSIMQSIQQFFSNADLKSLLLQEWHIPPTGFDDKTLLNNELSGFDKMMAIDMKTYQLDEILVKVDRATMSASLEGREPLLDYRLVEFVARLDPNLKIKDGNKKYLLKKITHKYLPESLMDRPKMGFNIPLVDWLKVELKDYLMMYLDKKRIEKAGILNADLVVSLRDRYLLGEKVSFNQIWNLLMFEMWREKWMSK